MTTETADGTETTGDDLPLHTAILMSRTPLSPHLARLTFGEIAPDFVSTGRADEFVSLSIPAAEAGQPPVVRYYTIRSWRADAGELDIDFVLHGHGPASGWAQRAVPGDIIGIDAPRGHYDPPAEAQWIGLAGDATALPAIARVLDERAPGGPPVHVVVAVESEADRLDLSLRPGDSLDWLRPGDDLAGAAKALASRDQPGYLWFSGEAADMRTVRSYVRRELRQPTRQWMTMAYWRRDSGRWRERFDSLEPEFLQRLERIYATDDDPEVQRDRAEELLARHGL
ncbi:siderophore-interacting protein [Compostimonas suwonensis]|uniref:NADPH-dependent ferric siderophore reductase n=1 Tax=Compostimonas suwonensis TaxID=1048394 RepID=A0A2M9BWP8_9MICO|nr:siderophore-interacting protein [Compostimonas suwonensis]PJJ62369.1 NADPH-dependent ferric siderophore reductase [Compostimonas suwonensis]